MTRPRKAQPRRHQVNMRFTTHELLRIHQHASLTGKTLTDFGRTVMLRRPRPRHKGSPQLLSLPHQRLERWRTLGNEINQLAHDFNARHELDPRHFAVRLTRIGVLLRRNIIQRLEDDAGLASYELTPAVRYQLRKLCTNLVQIADRFRALGRAPPLPLSNLISRLRAVLNGDRAAHGA